jgi:hypothetical protein
MHNMTKCKYCGSAIKFARAWVSARSTWIALDLDGQKHFAKCERIVQTSAAKPPYKPTYPLRYDASRVGATLP